MQPVGIAFEIGAQPCLVTEGSGFIPVGIVLRLQLKPASFGLFLEFLRAESGLIVKTLDLLAREEPGLVEVLIALPGPDGCAGAASEDAVDAARVVVQQGQVALDLAALVARQVQRLLDPLGPRLGAFVEACDAVSGHVDEIAIRIGLDIAAVGVGCVVLLGTPPGKTIPQAVFVAGVVTRIRRGHDRGGRLAEENLVGCDKAVDADIPALRALFNRRARLCQRRGNEARHRARPGTHKRHALRHLDVAESDFKERPEVSTCVVAGNGKNGLARNALQPGKHRRKRQGIRGQRDQRLGLGIDGQEIGFNLGVDEAPREDNQHRVCITRHLAEFRERRLHIAKIRFSRRDDPHAGIAQ